MKARAGVPPLEENSNSDRGKTPGASRKPLLALAAIPALFLGVLAIIIWRDSLTGFFKTNYLYYLGHHKQWEKARGRLNDVPAIARRGARYSLVKMNILLNLARTSEALEFLASRPLDSLPPSHRNRVAFEQAGGFGLLLIGKDKEAAQLFKKHPGNRLSIAMAALLDQVRGESEAGKAKPSPDEEALLALIEKETLFPPLCKYAAQYLLARRHIQRGEFAEAAEPLEDACVQYPYYPVFHHCLARAYLAQRRYDLATMHLTMARHQLRDTNLHTFSEADEKSFETIVLRDVLKQAETSELSNFWRLLRGLRNVFPDALSGPPITPNPHPMSLAEIWEWGALLRDFQKEKTEDLGVRNLAPEDARLFLAIEGVTAAPPAKPLEIALKDEPTSAGLSSRFLAIMPINRQEKSVAADSQSLSFLVRFPREHPADKVLDQVLLFRIRATERQCVAGGCEVRLGQDFYWIYANNQRQWYGVPFPPLRSGEIPLLFRLHRRFIPGYSDPGKKGHRNLYVSTILLCTLYERENG